jgi:signal transduction histidine kinase/CheY-like chemotaxis protein
MRRQSPGRLILLNLLLAAGYFLSGKAGLWFAQVNPSATAIWPNTGIAIAAFLLLGDACWPAILSGAFLVNLTTTGAIASSIGIAAGNALEGFVGAWLIQRFAGGASVFGRASDTFRFAGVSMVSTSISATCGVLSLVLSGLALWSQAGSIWLTWWLGDLAGALLFAPLIILWCVRPARTGGTYRWLEAAAVMATLVFAALFVFSPALTAVPHGSVWFLCLPPLVWIAFRFGPRETATGITALAGIATWGTLRGYGPFAVGSLYAELVLQGFMITIAATVMGMAALVADGKRNEAERLRLLEAARRAQADAEAADRAKDQFIAMLGHELRNPLAAVSMAAHFTKRASLADADSAAAHEVIERQVQQLARLVDDLLDASRAATGKVSINRARVDLAGIAAACVDGMRSSPLMAAHNVEFTGEPAWVDGDPARLEQITANLLGNALKYTPPGGTIRMRVGRERDRNGEAAFLSVCDTGIGLEADLLPRVFDLFVQGTTGAAHAPGGLGIGLTLVKRFVELHGGTITAASEGTSHGATFVARFPAVDPPAVRTPGPETLQPNAPTGEERRVLLIEDQADVRQMLRIALEGLGHEVCEASCGADALRAVEHFGPHAAVVDIGLPEMDGYEVARRLRQLPSGPALRLVAVTGYGDLHSRTLADAAGFDFYLIKPVNLVRLGQVILA